MLANDTKTQVINANDDAAVPLVARDDDLRDALLAKLRYAMGKVPAQATVHDWRIALTLVVRDRITDSWIASDAKVRETNAKRVHYLSLEFLIGRLLEDALVNLSLWQEADAALADFGADLATVVADEPDAALGNGGLGRLAACFLESLSTVACPAIGYGIRYEHGLFRQSFDAEGRQIERPETWLTEQHAWEFERPEADVAVRFGGHVDLGKWHPAETVVARAHDTPVVGWQGAFVNRLRLWSARSAEGFDLDAFNRGDHVTAAQGEAWARTISRVLYPDDSTDEGRELRLKQEYFFTAASLMDLVRRFEAEARARGSEPDLTRLSERAAIQLNDTHPAIAGPELVRILHDERGLSLERAITIARECLSYTNHTLLPEALEKWGEDLMRRLLPRHMQIIEHIDHTHRMRFGQQTPIIADGQVRMGELSFVMAHRVNGVSALHTELMKKTVFTDLHAAHPERIVNQTNGVTPRRWLRSANPRLSALIDETIGDGWTDDLERLADLEPHVADAGWRERFAAVKRHNKERLSNFFGKRLGVAVDPEAMFDIQIKRIHEYKRQHLNILETVALWQAMVDEPEADWAPRVVVFGGKAAPAYHFAKDIIHLVNAVARTVNADARTRGRLRVVYPPNYNVTLAERLIPAADLSEQISTAGKEASGTGNMKFALNGALTIGTLDGANVEIRERVGADNFFLFGMTADEVTARRQVWGHAGQAVAECPRLARALEAIGSGTFSRDDPDRFRGIVENVSGQDHFLVSSDFADYWRASREADALFGDHDEWTRRAALNTARSGWFSSDRTIRGYMDEIWGATSMEMAAKRKAA